MINILKLREMQNKTGAEKPKPEKNKKNDEKSKKKAAKTSVKSKQGKAKKQTTPVHEEIKQDFQVIEEKPEIKAEADKPEMEEKEVVETKKSDEEPIKAGNDKSEAADKLRQQLLEELLIAEEAAKPDEKESSADNKPEEDNAEINVEDGKEEKSESVVDKKEKTSKEEKKPVPVLKPPQYKSEPEEVKDEPTVQKSEPKQELAEVKPAQEVQGKFGIEAEEKNDRKQEIIQLVGFILGKEHYGVEIDKIQEINRMSEITKVPNAPKYVEGVINLRGAVLPVVNLRIKIGMAPKEYDQKTRIMIIELDGMAIGFIVDEVKEVLRINRDLLSAPPEFSTNMKSEYISAVAKLENELVILIDPEKLLIDEL